MFHISSSHISSIRLSSSPTLAFSELLRDHRHRRFSLVRDDLELWP